MGKKFPNASVLSLITQSEGDAEKVLFIYLKVVSDFSGEDTICWLKGKNGKPDMVWKSLSINQWVAFGKDEIVQTLIDKLLEERILRIGNKEIPLILPLYEIISKETDSNHYLSETDFQSFRIISDHFISPLFYQKENLQILSGYKMETNEVRPLFPFGFYENDFIYANLKKNIFGIREYRTAYLTFHGVKSVSKKGEGSKAITGFYQQNFDENGSYFARLKNKDTTELGRSEINKDTGLFYIDLKEPVISGKIEVFKNEELEKKEDFTLIQNIEFNMRVSSKDWTDIYDRNFIISSDKEARPNHIESFSWQQEVYVERNRANEKLSDRFKLLLDYLGPRVLIADPYFLGNIHFDNITNHFSLYDDQLAFLNAMALSYHMTDLEKIIVLGVWKRTKNQVNAGGIDTRKDIFFNTYKSCLNSFVATNQLIFKMSFLEAQKEFHNRYWFSLIEQDGIERLDKCVIVTNSIGNIEEVDFIPVVNEGQLRQITRKYTGLYKNAELKLEI